MFLMKYKLMERRKKIKGGINWDDGHCIADNADTIASNVVTVDSAT